MTASLRLVESPPLPTTPSIAPPPTDPTHPHPPTSPGRQQHPLNLPPYTHLAIDVFLDPKSHRASRMPSHMSKSNVTPRLVVTRVTPFRAQDMIRDKYVLNRLSKCVAEKGLKGALSFHQKHGKKGLLLEKEWAKWAICLLLPSGIMWSRGTRWMRVCMTGIVTPPSFSAFQKVCRSTRCTKMPLSDLRMVKTGFRQKE